MGGVADFQARHPALAPRLPKQGVGRARVGVCVARGCKAHTKTAETTQSSGRRLPGAPMYIVLITVDEPQQKRLLVDSET